MRRPFLLAILGLVGAAVVFELDRDFSSTTVTSAPPNPGPQMQWYRSHTAAALS